MAQSRFLGAGSDQSLNTTDSPTFAGLTVTGRAFTRQATVELTDAQIKALPTTALEIVAAPGSGKALVLSAVVIRSVLTAGYTNVDPTATVDVKANGSGLRAQLKNTNGELESVLGSSKYAFLSSSQEATPDFTSGVEWHPDDVDNKNLTIQVSNGGAGDLTGGNAANVLRVSVAYLVINLSTGQFE